MFWRKIVRNYSTCRLPNNNNNDKHYLIVGAAAIIYISSKTLKISETSNTSQIYYLRKY